MDLESDIPTGQCSWSTRPDHGSIRVLHSLLCHIGSIVCCRQELLERGCSEAFKVIVVADHYSCLETSLLVPSSGCYFDLFLILYLSNSNTKISTNIETVLNAVHIFVHTKLAQST